MKRAGVVDRLGRRLPDHPGTQALTVGVDEREQLLGVAQHVGANGDAVAEVPLELVHAVAAAARCRSSSCRTRRSTLPTSVSGSESRNSISLGARYPVSPCVRVLAPRDQLLGGEGGAFLQHDVGLHALAGALVGQAHHRALRDRRMVVEHVLDLVRVHVEPRDQDHVLEPVHDREVAVGVGHRDVAGVEPAVADRERGLLRAPPVAEHHLRAPGCRARRARRAASPCPGRRST